MDFIYDTVKEALGPWALPFAIGGVVVVVIMINVEKWKKNRGR